MNTDSILVATDFTEPSLKAVRYAVELAKRFDTRLHVLHVIREMIFYSPTFGGYMPSRDQYAAAAAAALENAVDTDLAGNVPVTTEYRFGSPHTEILKCAKDIGSSLIVVGTHGRSELSHAVIGSVAENVVRHASGPVLTVHCDEHEFVS
jgi:nucleotide-binding universal stress UspA family protein